MTVDVLDKPGLQRVLATILNGWGLSPNAITWGLDPQSAIGDVDRARVVLEVFSMSSLGVDEHRYVYDDPAQPANSLEVLELGNRHIKINVRAETFDYSVEASELLDWIRTGIRTYASTQALNAINLAFVEAEQATRVRYVVNERVVNAAVADFTFAGVAQQVSSVSVDGSGNDITTIETVNTNNVVPGTLT